VYGHNFILNARIIGINSRYRAIFGLQYLAYHAHEVTCAAIQDHISSMFMSLKIKIQVFEARACRPGAPRVRLDVL
jgi:hypothetical protein